MAESYGGIVLAGGKSTRMGSSKALLPFGSETMLQRVVRLLGEVVSPIVVVAAGDQELPTLPRGVIVTRDEQEGRGPLEGLRAGLKALPQDIDAAYVTSCDVPLLVPGFVRQMIEFASGYDIAVMVVDGFTHPLSAVYRRSTLSHIERLLDANQLRPAFLFGAVKTRHVHGEEMTADPDLRTLRNLNTREDYERALAESAASGETSPRATSTRVTTPANVNRAPFHAVVALIAALIGVAFAYASERAEGFGGLLYLMMTVIGSIGGLGLGLLLCIPKATRAFAGVLMLAGIALGAGFAIGLMLMA